MRNFMRGLLPLFVGLGLLVMMLLPLTHIAAEGVQNLADVTPGNVPIVPAVPQNGPASSDGPNGLTYYTDRPTFEAAYPGLPLEDFNDTLIGPGAITGCAAPFDAATNNACFSPGTIIPGVHFQDNPLNGTGGGSATGLVVVGTGAFGNSSPTIAANTFVDIFEIVFDAPGATSAGMDLVDYLSAQTVNINIYDLSDALIGTTTGPATNNEGSFFGVASGTPIGRITIEAPNNSGDGAEGVDNFSYGFSQTSAPAIVLTKTVGVTAGVCASTDTISVPGAGADVYYCYEVMNTGDITLSLHNLVDDQLGTLLSGFPFDLAPGASVDSVAAGLEISATITQTTVNSATWTAFNNSQETASANATATVNVSTTPTSVSLTGFGDSGSSATPFLFGILVLLVAGFGFVMRRKLTA